MSHRDPHKTPPKASKPQYHYFYGSLDDSSRQPLHVTSPSAATLGTEGDSLIGEDLVPTDNEEEMPRNVNKDLEQLLVMNDDKIIMSSNPEQKRPWYSIFTMNHFRETHPLVHVFALITTISVFFFLISVLLFPFSQDATVDTAPASEVHFRMPFPIIQRADFKDPVEDIIQVNLFHPSLHNRDKAKDKNQAFVFPFPTGAFWTNLVLKPTADRGLSYPIVVYPYAYKWADNMLQASYPARHRQTLPKEVHDYFFPDLTFTIDEIVAHRYITRFDPLSVTLNFGSDRNKYFETYLVQGSPYITIKYHKVTPILKAFTTFTNLYCPREEDEMQIIFNDYEDEDENSDEHRRTSQKYGVCYSSDNDQEGPTSLTGVQFVLQTQERMDWLIFASEPITLLFDRKKISSIVARDQFQGILRFAYIPSSMSNNNAINGTGVRISSSTGLQRLIYHAGVFPTGGTVTWDFRGGAAVSTRKLQETTSASTVRASLNSKSEINRDPTSIRVGTIHFEYSAESFTASSSAVKPKSLLMLALPHHAACLSPSIQLDRDKFDLNYRSIKGPMKAVIGSSWSYDEPLPFKAFDDMLDDQKKYLSPSIRKQLVSTLRDDIKYALPTLTENVYGFGKQTARLAQLAYIANNLHIGNVTFIGGNQTLYSLPLDRLDQELATIRDKALEILSFTLRSFLSGNASDSLVFDANLGGIVSLDGLRNTEADFGNGRYNDHHFHYGYILYAAAILGHLSPHFLMEYGHHVDAIFYDIAHGSNFAATRVDGVFLPGSRHKVWYDGHSFASGLFPFANGKSQESSSEAVNGYFGAYLWSLVRHKAVSAPYADTSAQTDFARLLLASELRGARTYWHMVPTDIKTNISTTNQNETSVYDQGFAANYMVGNLGMLDALCSTWFGQRNLYVHMINFMPLTSITSALFDKDYVKNEYQKASGGTTDVEMAWKGYIVSDLAIIDPSAAWDIAQTLESPTMDSGLSKSQVLYWIATRPGFNASDIGNSSSTFGTTSADPDELAACHNNPDCINLDGLCCPTREGSFLECCGS